MAVLSSGARVQINDERDDQQRQRHDDEQPLLGAQHVFVLAAPENVVAGRQLDLAGGDGGVHGVHGVLDVGAHVNAVDVHINPVVRHGALGLDGHRAVHDFDVGEFAERNLRAGRRGNDDVALERIQIGTEIAVVTQIDGVALQTFHGRRQRHSAERDGQHVLHVADGQAVTRDGVAVDVEFNVMSAHHALGKGAGGAGHLADDGLDFVRRCVAMSPNPARRS